MTSNEAPSSEGAVKFEQAMARLAQIVEKLERGDLPLEESLALFEEGVMLSRLAQKRLDVAQQKVEKLLAVDDQGRPRTEPFTSSE